MAELSTQWNFFCTDKGTSNLFNVVLPVGLCLGTLSLVTCAVAGKLWYKQSRRSKKVNVYFKLIFTWMIRIVYNSRKPSRNNLKRQTGCVVSFMAAEEKEEKKLIKLYINY